MIARGQTTGLWISLIAWGQPPTAVTESLSSIMNTKFLEKGAYDFLCF